MSDKNEEVKGEEAKGEEAKGEEAKLEKKDLIAFAYAYQQIIERLLNRGTNLDGNYIQSRIEAALGSMEGQLGGNFKQFSRSSELRRLAESTEKHELKKRGIVAVDADATKKKKAAKHAARVAKAEAARKDRADKIKKAEAAGKNKPDKIADDLSGRDVDRSLRIFRSEYRKLSLIDARRALKDIEESGRRREDIFHDDILKKMRADKASNGKTKREMRIKESIILAFPEHYKLDRETYSLAENYANDIDGQTALDVLDAANRKGTSQMGGKSFVDLSKQALQDARVDSWLGSVLDDHDDYSEQDIDRIASEEGVALVPDDKIKSDEEVISEVGGKSNSLNNALAMEKADKLKTWKKVAITDFIFMNDLARAKTIAQTEDLMARAIALQKAGNSEEAAKLKRKAELNMEVIEEATRLLNNEAFEEGLGLAKVAPEEAFTGRDRNRAYNFGNMARYASDLAEYARTGDLSAVSDLYDYLNMFNKESKADSFAASRGAINARDYVLGTPTVNWKARNDDESRHAMFKDLVKLVKSPFVDNIASFIGTYFNGDENDPNVSYKDRINGFVNTLYDLIGMSRRTHEDGGLAYLDGRDPLSGNLDETSVIITNDAKRLAMPLVSELKRQGLLKKMGIDDEKGSSDYGNTIGDIVESKQDNKDNVKNYLEQLQGGKKLQNRRAGPSGRGGRNALGSGDSADKKAREVLTYTYDDNDDPDKDAEKDAKFRLHILQRDILARAKEIVAIEDALDPPLPQDGHFTFNPRVRSIIKSAIKRIDEKHAKDKNAKGKSAKGKNAKGKNAEEVDLNALLVEIKNEVDKLANEKERIRSALPEYEGD